jgi:glycosyltransferase involved in cell wall biosynthesis
MEKTRKQKVLIVHNYYQIPGGEDTVVANEKKLLEENGHEVLLYIRSNSELQHFSRWKKLMLPFSLVFNLRTYREVRKLIQNEKINIVHIHNTLSLISPSVYYAAFSCKIPVVQTIHNFRLLCPGATFYRDGHICEDCVTQSLRCAVKHRCYRSSRLQTIACVLNTKIHRAIGTYRRLNYICLTEFNKEKLIQLNKPGRKKIIEPEQVFVKPNFTFDTQEKVRHTTTRKQQFAYVGRLEKSKGIEVLLEAWKLMGSEAPELVICGSGTCEKRCREYISTNHLNQVTVRGFIPNEEVQKVISESMALILPTQWYEGFPMIIVEAYSTGTPVIGSGMGNVERLIEEGISGWKFQYDSAEALREAIVRFRDSYTSEWGENGYKKFESEYSSEKNYSILKNIYDTIID